MAVSQAASRTRRRAAELPPITRSSGISVNLWVPDIQVPQPGSPGCYLFLPLRCSPSRETSHEQPASKSIHLHKQLLHPSL